MNIRESNRGHLGDDLVGRHTLVLMPYHDIEYTHTMAGDAGLSAADVRLFSDPVLGGRGHDPSIVRHSDYRLALGWLAIRVEVVGGPGEIRTHDLFHAMEARSQLRHRPIVELCDQYNTATITDALRAPPARP